MNNQIYCSRPGEAGVIAKIISSANVEVASKFGLNRQNCSKHPSFCTADWIAEDFDRGVHYFLYPSKNGAVGCVAYERGEGKMAFLNRLAVLPDMQGQGIGESLVQFFLNHANEDGRDNVSIGIIAQHRKLIHWYEKFGFIQGEVKKYPHLPFDVIFMNYKLETP